VGAEALHGYEDGERGQDEIDGDVRVLAAAGAGDGGADHEDGEPDRGQRPEDGGGVQERRQEEADGAENLQAPIALTPASGTSSAQP
jgi:hypothetical protein